MPSYKLCYFNARGIGETARLMFAEAGMEYEDVRYAVEEWQKYKPNMLFHQMPVLFVDGEQIAHSRAAMRYLAREFKMDGGNSLNSAKMDMYIEVIMEGLMKFPFFEKDEKKKVELEAIAMNEELLPRLQKLETQINSCVGDYVFGETPTALDFFVYSMLYNMKRRAGEKFLEALPKIKAMMAAVEARERIAKWLSERPETEN